MFNWLSLGWLIGRRTPQIIRNRNELMQGPAPACLAALKAMTPGDLSCYPEGYSNSLLVPVLAERFGLAQEQVFITHGAEGLLKTVFDWLKEGDCVLVQEHHYPYYRLALQNKAIPMHTFAMPERGDDFFNDVDDCLRQYERHRPRLLVLASPANPTGTVMPVAEMVRILEKVTHETLVVLDEAYCGFDPEYDGAAVVGLLKRFPNLILARTFSKYYGLAGMRLGYALCGVAVMGTLRYMRPYLGLNTVSEKVALAALESEDYYRKTATEVISERGRMIAALRGMAQVTAYESRANLVLIKVSPAVEAKLKEALPKEKILIAREYKPGYWRISVGTPEVNTRFIELLAKIVRKVK